MDFGGESECPFVDVRVFNPFATSNAASSLSTCYKKHKNIKKRAYGQRISKSEYASCTPVVSQSLVDWLMRQVTFINALLLCCLISGGLILNSNGFVEMFLVLLFVTISYSMCLWRSLLDSTLCCSSSTNGFSKGGVQFIFGR